MSEPIIVYYCKALKHTGKPIIVRMDGKEKNVSEFVMKNVNIKMIFNNAKGNAKRSGATTVLEITRNES